jgi:AraC-like DNA-binding protein
VDYSVSFVKDYCQFLGSYQLAPAELYKILRTSSFKMNIPFLRIKAERVNELFKYAIEKTGDTNLGIKLPCQSWYIPDKVIYMLMWNSKSPLDALRIACKYAKLITTTVIALFTENENSFSIEFVESTQWQQNRQKWETLSKTTLDVSISTVQNSFAKMFNKVQFPIEIQLTTKSPADDEIYYETFKCPVYFNSGRNIITYDKSVLRKEKNLYYDKRTYDNVIKYADDLIRQQIQRTEEFSVIVENEILTLLGRENSFPTIQQVAANLDMSVRSFQRKLEQENLNYKNLLDSVRKNFAINYINRESNFSVNDLAWSLGYNDASAFVKAFKRWFGTTPSRFKEND